MRIYVPILTLCLAGATAAQTSLQSATVDQLQEAQQALEHNQIDKALSILHEFSATNSHFPGLQRELGRVYYRAGRLEEANAAFESAIHDDPSDDESVQMEGLILYRMGRQSAAIPYLERVRKWVPATNADANYVLALCYLKADRLDEARAAFARQFGTPANSAGSYLLLANMLLQERNADAAAQQAKNALALSPSLPMAHFTLGEVALQKNSALQAIDEFDAERRINPDYALAYDRLGEAYMRVDKLEEAQQTLIRAIALDRSDTDAFIKMGKVLLAKQDAPTAIMYLKIAEKMAPNDFATHALLAKAYHTVGQDEDARRENDLARQAHAEDQPVSQPAK